MPARLDIAVQRNEAFMATLTIADDAGVAIDLTGQTLAMQVKSKTSSTTVQAADIEVTDAVHGEITITVDASLGSPLHTHGDPLTTEELPYDLILTDAGGMPTALLAGYVILSRGVTG
jgi:hypothetical protein